MKQYDCRYCGGKGYDVKYSSYSEFTDNPSYARFKESRTDCKYCKGKGKVSAGVHFIQKTVIERDIPF